jgi:two-component system, LuxR family, sensor kinase FixL
MPRVTAGIVMPAVAGATMTRYVVNVNHVSATDIPSIERADNSKSIALAVAYIALYLLLDWASYVEPVRHTGVTAWNPNTGLLMALLLSRGERWGLLAAIGCFLGDLLIDDAPAPWRTTALTSLYLAAVYTSAAWTLRRSKSGPAIETPAGAAWFAAIVAAATGVAAVGYVYILIGAAQLEPAEAWGDIGRYWIGEFNGVIALTPVFLTPRLSALREYVRRHPREFFLQCIGIAGGVCLAFVLAAARDVRMFYPLFLPVTWIALRNGVVGAMFSVSLVQSAIVAALELTHGSIPLFDVQFPLLALGITALFLGALATQRDRVMNQMVEQEAALQRAMRFAAASQLASALAHEINQPMTALLSYLRAATLLAESSSTNESLGGTLRKADAEAVRAIGVLRRLREFYRGDGAGAEAVDIGALCERVADSFSDRARSNGIEIRLDCAAHLPKLVFARTQLELVVHNLLTNALDAFNAPAVSKARPRIIEVTAAARQSDVLISVQDSGPGIGADVAAKLFEPLVTSKANGMGLGLSLSRSMLRSQGGELWMEAPNHLGGARFVIRVPLQPTAQVSL